MFVSVSWLVCQCGIGLLDGHVFNSMSMRLLHLSKNVAAWILNSPIIQLPLTSPGKVLSEVPGSHHHMYPVAWHCIELLHYIASDCNLSLQCSCVVFTHVSSAARILKCQTLEVICLSAALISNRIRTLHSTNCYTKSVVHRELPNALFQQWSNL